MKHLIALAFVALFSVSAMAQQVDLRKKITVSGTAEEEVTPDIIYISISLKEYLKDGNSKKKEWKLVTWKINCTVQYKMQASPRKI